MIRDGLAHLAPVALDALVDVAGLLTRVDRKYVVELQRVPGLLAGLPEGARALEIDGERVFGYRSTYLDTPALDGYFAAGQGRRRRFKVRTRAYLDTGTSWLEVKTRGSRGTTVKQRMPHPDAETVPVSPDGHTFVDAALASGRINRVRPQELTPVLVTAYRRATVLLPATASRVTIDVDLGWTSLRPRCPGELARPSLAIVETKTGSTPSEVDRLLWSHGHRPVRISKYAVGMAALDPTLPRLRWARTLRRELAIPAPTLPSSPQEDR
ncbi:UNVERIFIED_CONTAM: hypothetical protein LK11_43530 [Mumia flava]